MKLVNATCSGNWIGTLMMAAELPWLEQMVRVKLHYFALSPVN